MPYVFEKDENISYYGKIYIECWACTRNQREAKNPKLINKRKKISKMTATKGTHDKQTELKVSAYIVVKNENNNSRDMILLQLVNIHG